jgi:Arc/MetJ-type ribon-helix-helix transcriptional regulator
MARITFSLTDATVAQIRQTAARLRQPQSHVVRDAVAEYASRADRLSERERYQILSVLERLREAKPTRAVSDVDRELRALRTARRSGGRRHRSE